MGKSAKLILIQFRQRDAAVQHLQKESTILSEINLLSGMSSVVTKISIIIKHCDTEVRPIAETVFQSNSPYLTVQSFLDDFRQNRFLVFMTIAEWLSMI